MFPDSRSDIVLFTKELGVNFAHYSLQFRKLTDHLGRQVKLVNVGSPVKVR